MDDPQDPGGPTNLGVMLGTLRPWLGRPAAKALIVAKWRQSTVGASETRFRMIASPPVWTTRYTTSPSRADRRGHHRPQRAIGVADDGKLGPITLAAVAYRVTRMLMGPYAPVGSPS
ncbi:MULTISPECIES: hypothetical protein [Methylobacterium]|uniref:hypothetical protein n=1 Tax=Methylobacterium TaxID=407 RepID=UPI00272EA82C|nr:hypothetical protein [Methylobacterium sp.]